MKTNNSTPDTLKFTSQNYGSEMEIGSKDADQEIQFTLRQCERETTVYLSQKNIAELIQHLQNNLIK
jgi:hypothetical protein